MFAFMIDKPVDHVLLAFRASTAASRKSLTRRRVHSQCEEIRRFRKISDKTAMEGEVEKDENVQEKNKKENDDPGFGWIVDAAGCILLCDNRCIEVLCLRVLKHRLGVILGMLA